MFTETLGLSLLALVLEQREFPGFQQSHLYVCQKDANKTIFSTPTCVYGHINLYIFTLLQKFACVLRAISDEFLTVPFPVGMPVVRSSVGDTPV